MPKPPPDPGDRHRLSAAEGWLALGLPSDALAELDGLSAAAARDPEALHWRCLALGRLRRLDELLEMGRRLESTVPADPRGPLHTANALHWLGRSEDAYQHIRGSLDRFADSWHLAYDLACYAAQTRRLDEAVDWYRKALQHASHPDSLREYARQDPDLEPVREQLG